MKKFLLLIFAIILLGNAGVSAQSRWGVIGGMSFMRAPEMNRSSYTLWHAGFTYKLGLPSGFAIQPSLMYQTKGAKTNEPMTIQTGYIELPVSVQWGPDLLVCRPFLDVTPFVGYAVCNKMWDRRTRVRPDGMWDALNRWEYGVGVGVGLEIWRFQVIGRYMWNFGDFVKRDGSAVIGPYVSDALSNGNYRGFVLSVSFLFGGGWKR